MNINQTFECYILKALFVQNADRADVVFVIF